MNREDIIKLARECQFAHYYESGDLVAMPQLERFAALVAAAERSACAKACEALLSTVNTGDEHMDGVTDCIAAIRARGEK
jgi:hypothetical protein